MSEEKRVPLYLGEGPDRRWIGTAKVTETEDGNWHVEGLLEGWRDEDNYSSPLFHGVLPKKKPEIQEASLYSFGPAEGGLGKMETS